MMSLLLGAEAQWPSELAGNALVTHTYTSLADQAESSREGRILTS